jgi:hypothetical protein
MDEYTDEHRDPYERLQEECKRRGYDFDFMLRFAIGLAERKDRKVVIPRCRSQAKKPGRGKKRTVNPISAWINGKKMFTFQSVLDASEAMNISPHCIRMCLSGSYNTAGKYEGKKIVWKFEQENQEK